MSTLTFGMGLILPTVGVDSGLVWANAMNTNSNVINGHTHALGSGTQIDATGINLVTDLAFNGTNATDLRSVRFTAQGTPISLPTDLNCLSVTGVDLYYRDGNSNIIQVTSGGAVLATSSGITNGTNSASFISSILTVVSAPNTPGNIRAGSYFMGNAGLAGGFYVTLAPRNPLTSNYTLTLPALPASTSVLEIDTSGNITPVPVTEALNPPGTVVAFAGPSAPTGWLICDGSSLLRAAYPALFAVIGFNYGAVDGAHFNLPTLINRAPFGIGSRFILAQIGGNLDPNNDTLTTHNHVANVSDPGHIHGAPNGFQFVTTSGVNPPFANGGSGGRDNTTAFAGTGISVTTNNFGNSATNGNMPPFIGMNYIIKT